MSALLRLEPLDRPVEVPARLLEVVEYGLAALLPRTRDVLDGVAEAEEDDAFREPRGDDLDRLVDRVLAAVVRRVVVLRSGLLHAGQRLRSEAPIDVVCPDPVSYTHLTLPTSDLV